MSTIGDRIRIARVENKLTQDELAKALGVASITVLRWEKDRNIPKVEDIHKIANVLSTPVTSLMGDSPPENNEKNVANEFEASENLDQIISDLAKHNPDLIVMFRDTKRNWAEIPDKTKAKIADGMKFVLELGELDEREFRTPKSDKDL